MVKLTDKVQSLEGSRLLYNDLRRRIGEVSIPLTLKIGVVETGPPGSKAEASITGTAPDLYLNLTIPEGNVGPAGPAGEGASIEVGEVITGEPDSPVVVTNSGTDTHAILNFSIPRGRDGSSGEGTYIHEQAVAASTWLVNHNLNKYPSVTVVDSQGTVMVCGVQYTDRDNCVITTNAPFKGWAYLN